MSAEKRRSPRIKVEIVLDAEWSAATGTVRQKITTESISAHGALLRLICLDHPPRETILLKSPSSKQKRMGRVVGVLDHVEETPGLVMVRVDFGTDSADFWKPLLNKEQRSLLVRR